MPGRSQSVEGLFCGLPPSVWDRLERVLDRFENAWRAGWRPVLDEYLTESERERQGLLIELVHADLYYRLKSGEVIRVEDYLRTKATRAVIKRRSAREAIPAPPLNYETSMSVAAGRNLYSMDCAGCHGEHEPSPTPVGRGMFPRAVDLDSPNVQAYSDRELFSIIRGGIRFSGMPGFAAVETGDQTWNLVDYVRSLR